MLCYNYFVPQVTARKLGWIVGELSNKLCQELDICSKFQEAMIKLR